MVINWKMIHCLEENGYHCFLGHQDSKTRLFDIISARVIFQPVLLLTLSAFGDTKLGPVSGWEWFSESPICVEVRALPGERKIVHRDTSVTVVGWVNAFIGSRWPELEIVEVSGSCIGGAVRGNCEIWLA